MSLVEEELPGVNTVRQNFRVKEDAVLARQLQEREYDDHFNSNVQLRRTAMEDTRMAKKYQMEELGQFKEHESIRQQQLRAQEEMDFAEAERMTRLLEQEEEVRKHQDEEMALKFHEEESEMEKRKREQEEIDMRLARQHFEREKRMKEEEKRKREMEDAEAAKRLQQLEISKSKGGMSNGAVAGMSGVGGTKPTMPSPLTDLPSYDSLGIMSVPDIPQVEDEDDFEEPVDEMARQEEEDARLARELMEREQQAEARRKAEQERADIELARKLMEAEKKPKSVERNPSNSDFEIAQRMSSSDREKLRQQKEQERRDMELAQKVKGDLQRQQSEQEVEDWEFAKRLQKEELKKARACQPPQATQNQISPTSSLTHSTPPVQGQTTSPTKSAPSSLTFSQGSEPVQTGYRRLDDSPDGPNNSPTTVKMGYKRQPVKQSSKKGLFKKNK